MADPSHVEQILVNLAIDAGDALRPGGRVTIAVHPPGSVRSWAGKEEWLVQDGFAELSVEDDDRRRHRNHEPERREVRVPSEPGVGTCLLLYWPVAMEA